MDSAPTHRGAPFIDEECVDVALAEVRAGLEGDGATVSLVRVDHASGQVHVELHLDDAECADCVLPPEALSEVITDIFHRNVPGVVGVALHDPRASKQEPTGQTGGA